MVRSGKDGVVKSALNRREFNGLCGALCSFVASSGALALDAATAVALNGTAQTVKFRDATVVPAIGQGSARIGQGRHPAAEEEEALRTGLSLGMTLIDTSGDYGEGRSEELIKRVIAGQRDRAFVVSKVEANDVARGAMARACEASLSRLGTDYLDLLFVTLASFGRSFSRGRCGIRTPARGEQNSFLGRVQLLSPPNGRPIPYSTRGSLRDQSGPL